MTEASNADVEQAAALLATDGRAAEKKRMAEVQALGEQIVEQLKTVFDPEIPVNIYELGLVYKIDVEDDNTVLIDMTLTSPHCPVAETLPPEVLKVSTGKRAEPRIPFGSLIERGLVKAGDTLCDPTQRVAAKVRADGSIACRDASGSIHKIGAHVQGAEACNGWVFWHVRKGKSLIPIDLLRQQMRAEMAAAG